MKDLKMQLHRQEKEHKRDMKLLEAERNDVANRLDDCLNKLAIAKKEKQRAWCSVQTADEEMWEYQGNAGKWVPFPVSLLELRDFFLSHLKIP